MKNARAYKFQYNPTPFFSRMKLNNIILYNIWKKFEYRKCVVYDGDKEAPIHAWKKRKIHKRTHILFKEKEINQLFLIAPVKITLFFSPRGVRTVEKKKTHFFPFHPSSSHRILFHSRPGFKIQGKSRK